MTATIMQILDIGIVNVALPEIQGNFSTTPDQISWVVTSYLIASAIFMPLTGYFTDKFGQKRFFFYSVLGFTLASMLCGLSLNLNQLVFFRLLQGILGAALVPLSQAILLNVHPKKDHGKAMAIWGAGVMIGPILGPTLGGYLTELLSWRWAFYINAPIGSFCLFLIWKELPDSEQKARTLDWPSLICLACTIGSIQFILDRGNQNDWFQSNTIQIMSLFAIAGFCGYFFLSFFRKSIKPIFSVELFKDHNFLFACLMMAIMGLGLFGTVLIQTLMLQNLLGYPPHLAGLTLAPRGLASMISMIFVGKFSTRIEPKILIATGILLNLFGTHLCTHFSLNVDLFWIVVPTLIQGLGLGLVVVPLSTLALSTLSPHLRSEGAGLFSLMRTFGLSMGASIAITILTRNTQILWEQMRGSINPFNPELYIYLQRLNLTPTEPLATAVLAREVLKQASMISTLDVFVTITWSFAAILPLTLLLKSSNLKEQPLLMES